MGILKQTDVPQPFPLRPRILAVIGFVVFVNLFFFHRTGAMAHVLLAMGLGSLFLFLFWPAVRSSARQRRILLYAGVFGAALIGILLRASTFPSLILHLLTAVLLLFFLYEYAVSTARVASLLETAMVPFSLLNEYIRGMSAGVAHAWQRSADRSHQGTKRSSRILVSIVIGITIGLPAVAILLSLFSGADPIFAASLRHITQLLQGWFTGEAWERLIIRGVFSVLLFCLFLPLLFFRRRPFRSWLPSFATHRFIIELSIVLLMVIGTIGAFLLIQWPYVFAAVPLRRTYPVLVWPPIPSM